jgi:excisionase family DNA binding protein
LFLELKGAFMRTNDLIPEQDLFSVKEFSKVLRISPWTTYQWLSSGKLKALRLGRLRRIPRSEMLRLLDIEEALNDD